MNKMFRAIIVALIFSVATFNECHCKCVKRKCSKGWIKEHSPDLELSVNYAKLVEEHAASQEFKAGENKLPVDIKFDIKHKDNEFKVTLIIEESKQEDFQKSYLPLQLVILNQTASENDKFTSYLAANHVNMWRQGNVMPVPYEMEFYFLSYLFEQYKKDFVKDGNFIVRPIFSPCFSECQNEYVKSNGVLNLSIYPLSEIVDGNTKDLFSTYYSPIFYTRPSAIRIWPTIAFTQYEGNFHIAVVCYLLESPFNPQTDALNIKLTLFDQSNVANPKHITKTQPTQTSRAVFEFKIADDLKNTYVKSDKLKLRFKATEIEK